jgi:hypothetical protein
MFPRFGVKIPPKIKEYLKDNLEAPFVIGFQLFLTLSAGLLVQGNLVMADEVAVYTYFLLVIGVVLQLIAYVRHGNMMEKKSDDQ